MMKTHIFTLTLIFLVFVCQPVFSATWYVSTNGNNASAGTSYLLAWRTVNFAINNPSVSPGDTILAANDGIYTEQVTWPSMDGIHLIGWDYMVNGQYTTIDAQQSGRVITITGAALIPITKNTTIENFNLINGFTAGDGAGMHITGNVAPHLKNLVIASDSCLGNGGGIYYEPLNWYVQDSCHFWGASVLPMILDLVVIQNNWAIDQSTGRGSGAGIYILAAQQSADTSCPGISTGDATILLNDCIIETNKCELNGGGHLCHQRDAGCL